MKRLCSIKKDGHRLFTFSSTRGCTHNCFFCYRHIRGYRSYGKKRLEENIKLLHEKKCNFIWFNDENITSNIEWLKNLCDITKKYDIYWIGYGRADDITEEVVEILKDSNCCEMFVGVESFDQEMLNRMNKKITTQQNIDAVNLIYQYGLSYQFCLIIGTPGEDRETIFNTRKGMWQCYFVLDFLDLAFLSPYPGSAAYHYGIKKGYIKNKNEAHEKLFEKNDLVINMSELSDRELNAWHRWIRLEFAISYRVKHAALSADYVFLKVLKNYLREYLFLLKEPINFIMFNIFLLKGFSYWLKPVKKVKWAEFRDTLVEPKRISLRYSLTRLFVKCLSFIK